METFVIYSDSIKERLDPLYLKSISVIRNVKTSYPLISLGELLKGLPQYGANERAIDGSPSKDVRYIRITDIDEFGNLRDDDWQTAKNIETKYLLIENDILFARSGATAGKCFIYKKKYGKAIYAGYLIRFKFNEAKVNPLYVFFYTQSQRYALWVKSIQRPSGQPNINSEEFKAFTIPLPPLAVQNKIVEIMQSAYAQKRQKEQEADKLLESIDEYVLGELGIKIPELKDKMYFSVDSEETTNNRLDSYYYQPKFKEVENCLKKGKYNIKPLNKIVDFIAGYAFKSSDYVNSGIPLLRIQNITDWDINFDSDIFLPNECLEKYKKFKLLDRDILISMTGAKEGTGSVGKVAINDKKGVGLVNQRIGILRVKSDEVKNYYLYSYLKTKIFRILLIRNSVISVQVNASEDDILKIPAPSPPLKIQDKIAEEVKSRLEKAEKLKAEAQNIIENAKKEVEEIILGKTK